MTSYVSIDGYVVTRVTERAIGVRKAIGGIGHTILWIPRSQVESGDSLDIGDTDIVVAEWLVERDGLDV